MIDYLQPPLTSKMRMKVPSQQPFGGWEAQYDRDYLRAKTIEHEREEKKRIAKRAEEKAAAEAAEEEANATES